MNDRPVARLIEDVLRATAPFMTFYLTSRYAEREGDPDIADFMFGNPHDMPAEDLVATIRRWVTPQSKDWFAYRMAHEPALKAVAASLTAERAVGYEPEDVFLTPGTFGALSVALRTILDPGDEVLYLSPPWFFYEAMILVAGGTPVRVDARPPGFDLPLDAIAAALSPRTRAIIVNTPNNPGGRIYPPGDLATLGGLLAGAAERAGHRIYLLADESYRRIVFDARTFTSPADHYPATLVLYTYGKTLLAPGQRLGYIALPSTMPDREALRQAIMLSQVAGGWQFPNAVLQYALPELEALSIDLERLQRRRDRLVSALTGMGYETRPPEGTFYLLCRSPDPDDAAFAARLAERDVFVLPGSTFELPGYFRLSVTANDEMIERALPVFERAIARASG